MEAQWWLPPLAAFVISFFTSMVGISGAFLLLPIQISFLGLTGPAVSATNLVFNLIAIPAGVYRYWREKRILWPLVLIVIAGTTPGVIAGGFIRLSVLADAGRFKAFVGCVLLWVGLRMVADIFKSRNKVDAPGVQGESRVRLVKFTARELVFEFHQQRYRCSPGGIFVLSLVVGLVGGIYGIGGGAIIAPFFVAIYGLPVHTIAGATLMGTFATSVVGVGFYQSVAPFYQTHGMLVAPDWALGIRFGLGGIAGMYLGARTQRFIPALYLKIMLTIILFGVSLAYIWGFLRMHPQFGYAALPAVMVILALAYWWVRRKRLLKAKSRAAVR
ncbi:MAG: sulfite exporter TauE/SafE family protein [Candidatus Korobacteraceae bacterium]|jgi:uncharacterized membrane protein YfcA